MSGEYEIWHSPLPCSANRSVCNLSPRLPPLRCAQPNCLCYDGRPHLRSVTYVPCALPRGYRQLFTFSGLRKFKVTPMSPLPFLFWLVPCPVQSLWSLHRSVLIWKKKLIDQFCINWTLFLLRKVNRVISTL